MSSKKKSHRKTLPEELPKPEKETGMPREIVPDAPMLPPDQPEVFPKENPRTARQTEVPDPDDVS